MVPGAIDVSDVVACLGTKIPRSCVLACASLRTIYSNLVNI